MIRLLVVSCAFCCATFCSASFCHGMSPAQEAEPGSEISLAFYPLGELASGVVLPDGDGTDPSAGVIHGSTMPQGGGSAGTGFFSVPTAQIGVGGFGASPASQPATSIRPITRFDDRHALLSELIQSYVAPESWENNGGDGSIEAVNNTLLIRQSAENHALVKAFLAELHAKVIGGGPLQIEAWWIPITADQTAELEQMIASPQAADRLTAFCSRQQGYHAAARTREGVPTSLRSGGDKRVVTSVVPVVGTGSIGHQPVITSFPLGLNTVITADAVPDWEGTGLRLRLHSALTSLGDYTPRSDEQSVDRFQLNRISLTSACRCQPGRPIIAGRLTAVDAGDVVASSETELVLVILASTEQQD